MNDECVECRTTLTASDQQVQMLRKCKSYRYTWDMGTWYVRCRNGRNEYDYYFLSIDTFVEQSGYSYLHNKYNSLEEI